MTVAELINKSDHDLFCKLCAPAHALNHLLPPARNRASLTTRGHSHQLPEYSTDLHKKSFLIPCLYSFVKWNSFCTVRHSDFLCLLFDVRLLHLINITYIGPTCILSPSQSYSLKTLHSLAWFSPQLTSDDTERYDAGEKKSSASATAGMADGSLAYIPIGKFF